MTGDFDPSLDHLTEPALTALAARLGSVTGLGEAERRALHEGAAAALDETLRRKVNRVLVLELNAARIRGQLSGADSQERWQEWKELSATPEFWRSLTEHYPTMLPRLATIIDNRCAAAEALAHRFAADRDELAQLPDGMTGELVRVEFGAGDSHRGGQTVALLEGTDGRVVYKPRRLDVDAALARLISHLLPDHPAATRIRVPEVITRDGYGWAEHVQHRYCSDDAELCCFYRGIGHWLALMRLIGGSDLHAENLIAAGPVPVVVDCETLFTPQAPVQPTGYGLAVDRAAELLGESVLRTGLLPGRGQSLGWRGFDVSAVGALPGQQPIADMPVILDAGTDLARVGMERIEVPASANHPSPDPVLGSYWDLVLSGYTELSDRLDGLDRAGELEPLLAGFATCPIRVVLRATETYAELSRMLWHPVSLHDEAAGLRKAADLLTRQSEKLPGAPTDPKVIDAEAAGLLGGDIPFFSTTPGVGCLDGPGGTWGEQRDLVADALRRWRGRDPALDHQVIQAALVSAYLNEGWLPAEKRMVATRPRKDDLDRRRREVAAAIAGGLLESSVHGGDGTVTWITPVLNPTGWSVQALSPDMYGGAYGVAVLAAAYLAEAGQGRADEVPGLEPLLADVLRTITTAEDRDAEELARGGPKVRPEPPGGYVGLGSRIWGWLLLRGLGVAGSEAIARACALAERIPEAVAADDTYDLLTGMAGAVVPLLRLAECTKDERWSGMAFAIGERLAALATPTESGAYWANGKYPNGLGGLAHGATGIGWALSRLADAAEATASSPAFGVLADRAFAFEESLYDPKERGWRDMREVGRPGVIAAAWCHGAGGIGVVAADRLARGGGPQWEDVLRRAAAGCWADGFGWNHTLCHGDLGSWEVLAHAMEAGPAPEGLDRETLSAHILGTLEEYGPISGLARNAFTPGLLPGVGGVAYQLLRMHPDSGLPSVLLPDPEG